MVIPLRLFNLMREFAGKKKEEKSIWCITNCNQKWKRDQHMYLFTVGLDKSIPIRAQGVANFWQWGHNSSIPRTCPFKQTGISITTQDITVSIPPPKNNINTGTEELCLKSKERLEKGDRTSLPRQGPSQELCLQLALSPASCWAGRLKAPATGSQEENYSFQKERDTRGPIMSLTRNTNESSS